MIALGAAATFLHHAFRPEREYHGALAGLITDQQEPYRGETHPVLATGLLPGSVAWDLCEDTALLDETDQIVERFSKTIEASLDSETVDGFLEPCTYSGNKTTCPQPTPGIGPMWTDGSTESTLLVPSTVATIVRADLVATSILLASRDIEHYASFLDRKFSAGILNGMFFVGLSGALRIIPRWNENDLPAHRTFAGASYVYSTLSNERPQCPRRGHTRTLTRPYLDLAGVGVVRTMCQQVTVVRKVVGTLCFDFSPPEATLYRMLEEAARLFDLHLVRFYANGGMDECADIARCPSNLSSFSSGELADIEDHWRHRKREPAAGASAVTMLDDNRYFGAIVEHHNPKAREVGWNTVVLGRVQRSPNRDIASAIMMLLFVALASGLILYGALKKAKRLDLTLTRGLQVGVIELDIKDAIVGANDRAEEILGIELASFGSAAFADPLPFASLIEEDHIVPLDDRGELLSRSIAFVNYTVVNEQRKAGHSSSYYAITKESERLIRVSGSTFVSSRMELHTFGTIETFVDNDHKIKVLAAFKKSKAAQQLRADEGGT